MLLKEGDHHDLLRRCIDRPGNVLGTNSKGSVFRFYVVCEDDDGLVSAEGVHIFPCKLVTVGCQRWN